MKVMAFLVTCIAIFATTAWVSFDTDPFQTRNVMHSLTEMDPSVAYADSSRIYQGETASTMTWVEPTGLERVSTHDFSIVESDIDALCQSPTEAFKAHPRYAQIC